MDNLLDQKSNGETCNAGLIFHNCGIEKCKPGYSIGPEIKDYYIIHYIHKGNGIFKNGNKYFELCKGQGFLICPGEPTIIRADYKKPWSYYWIGFSGVEAEDYLRQVNFIFKNPVFEYPDTLTRENLFGDMLKISQSYNENVKELYLAGFLNRFISELIKLNNSYMDGRDIGPKQNMKSIYIEEAIKFIERNYYNKIYISHIAERLGLNPSYFGMIFKELIGISPKEFLTKYRIEKACFLMENKPYDINRVSSLVGYDDPLLFSKIFKKYKNITPSQYKNGDIRSKTS